MPRRLAEEGQGGSPALAVTKKSLARAGIASVMLIQRVSPRLHILRWLHFVSFKRRDDTEMEGGDSLLRGRTSETEMASSLLRRATFLSTGVLPTAT